MAPDRSLDETFCAPATAPVNSSIAIIRVNGPRSLESVGSIFSKPEKIRPGEACRGRISFEGRDVDDVVILYFKDPRSYTGDDLVEIYCHGNQFIVHRIITLLGQRGVRLAEPGEFTRRAFLNGKMDLTEAEAINHIICARSEWEIETALKQMHGSLRDVIAGIRNSAITLKADIEAGIDFIEENIEFVTKNEALSRARALRESLADLLLRCRTGQRLSRGIDIAIAGKPNVGKSSILNLILNQERAIVSDIPGTTRDMIRESVQIRGIHLNLIDTAGIGVPGDEIERIGIELSGKKIEEASLILCVLDAVTGITGEDRNILEKVKNKRVLYLINKADVTRDTLPGINAELPVEGIPFSARTGEGLAILEERISGILSAEFVDVDNAFIADIRITTLIEKALSCCSSVEELIASDSPLEIIAFEMQSLLDALSDMTGEITPDDVLGSIFSRFCIGK
ncbi:MAG TPA: tRNA uridine-5-carboxymethylaminomethyl(34) synthesis GTPase MnmE [Spirochaetota bacterium]|nr:tRNA uridine-5-carboxymethylaminomethyl(34) synthesis GTPase MnmE [Spirochaetota bacterium]